MNMRCGMRAAGLLPIVLISIATLGNVDCFVPYNTSSSRQEGMLNVHIVAHTHDDSGWLKTVEQYYYGSSQSIQLAAVQYILDTVIAALAANPDRKFSYAEMSFFSMWWSEQTDATRKLVRQLVKAGQLDFVNGGYVQNDEAAAHFVAMIDQTTIGHQFLNDTFGVTPRIGWQVDPFGHSATQASLLSGALGFDALYFGRADYQDMFRRSNKSVKALELLWRGAKSYGASADVFTGNFASGNYGPPSGFNWEWGSQDEPFVDHPGWEENNVNKVVQNFVTQCMSLAAVTRGNDIMLTMGTDFTYANAFLWYKNLDKLIHYANLDGRVNAFYSTPAAYTDAKHAYDAAWPLKTDDFFPYADCMTCYWTGYFTSRPTSKGYIRSSTSFLQAARQVELLGPTPLSSSSLTASAWVDGVGRRSPNKALELAVALTQHHDAITGTEKQHVANDYHRRLYAGMEEAGAAFTSSLASMVYGVASAVPAVVQAFFIRSTQLQSLASSPASAPAAASAAAAQPLGLCPLLNASVCHPTVEMSNLGHAILVVAYNPLGWPRREGVRVPLNATQYDSWTVEGPDGEAVDAQLLPVSDSTVALQAAMLKAEILPDLRAAATHELAFVAEVPALGYATFTVAPGRGNAAAPATQRAWLGGRRVADNATEPQAVVALSNGLIQVNVSTGTGRLLSLEDVTSGLTTPLTTEVIWYNSSDEFGPPPRTFAAPASGAYIFRPYSWVGSASPALVQVLEGPVLTEIRQARPLAFLPWITLTTRLWAGAKHMEVEWTAGPIPWADQLGKEVVVKYTSGLASGGTFYTDANGREMQRRERDARPTWTLDVHEPVAGNYYPLTSAMYIEGAAGEQLALVTDRAQGGASLAPGEMEVMVHRRTLRDDQRGVGEPISETECGCLYLSCLCAGLIARGSHHLAFQDASDAASYRRYLAQRVNDPLILTFGKAPDNSSSSGAAAAAGQPTTLAAASRSFLADPDGLPGSVQLVTLKDNGDGRVLLRLAHVYQVDEVSDNAGPVSLNLNKMFSGLSFDAVEEVALGAGQAYSQINRLKWQAGEHMSAVDANATLAAFAPRTALSCPAGCKGQAMTVELQPMEIRTFLLVPIFGLQWKS